MYQITTKDSLFYYLFQLIRLQCNHRINNANKNFVHTNFIKIMKIIITMSYITAVVHCSKGFSHIAIGKDFNTNFPRNFNSLRSSDAIYLW